MATVTPDLLAGTLTRGPEGWRHDRHYLVEDPGGSASVSLVNAVDTPGIPGQGTPHPDIPGLYALDYTVQAEGGDDPTYRVIVGYRVPSTSTEDSPPDPVPSGGTVQLGARVSATTRTNDIFGNQIVTQHTFSKQDGSGNTIQAEPVTQPGEVEVLVPTIVLSVTRTETSSPLGLARTHVGTVNDGPFAGEPAGTWLCTAIEGVSDDGGATYQINFEFELRPGGWEAAVVFVDPETNRPVEGITDGVELQFYTVYNASNFGALNLGL